MVHREQRDLDLRPLGFPLAPDMGGDYTYAAGDQRHRLTANGIWDVGRGFQVSGVYFFGSGERRTVNTGTDRRDEASGAGGGAAAAEQRLRADGACCGTISSAIRFTASTCVSSSAFRSSVTCGWMVCSSVQPVQPRELRLVHDERKQRTLRSAVV